MKICSKCGKAKSALDFSKNKKAKDRLQNFCKRCNAKYYKANQKKKDAYSKKYRLENPEKGIVASRKYCKANLERIKAYNKIYGEKYRAENCKREKIRKKKWYKENPDKIRENEARRRARKLNAFVAPVDRQKIFARDDGECHICKKKVDSNDWHLDHILPLSKNGTHEPKNVAVSHPRCNLKKQAKLEYYINPIA